jgi:hypothetical protein
MERHTGFVAADIDDTEEVGPALPLPEAPRGPRVEAVVVRLSAQQVSRLRLEALNSLLAGDVSPLVEVSERLCAAGQELLVTQSRLIDRVGSRAGLPQGRRSRARRVRRLAKVLPTPFSSGPLLERSFAYAEAVAESQSLPVRLPTETLARLIRSQLLVLAALLAEAAKVADTAPGQVLADAERER